MDSTYRRERATRRLTGYLVLSLIILTTMARQSFARSSEQEDTMMSMAEEGINLFKAKKYSEAVVKFKKAYEIVPDANLFFNIARCYELLGDKNNAIEYYNRFVYHPDVPKEDKERAKEHLKSLTDNSEKPITNPYESAQASQESPQQSPPVQLATGTQNKPRRSRALEWVLVGTGGAGLIAGGILDGLAIKTHDDFRATDDAKKKSDLEDKGKRQALIGDICLGAGAALAATGIVLLIVLDKDREQIAKEHSMTYAPFIVQNGGGMAFGMRY